MAVTTLTAEDLRKLLHYDPATGFFTWLVDRTNVKAGCIAGCIQSKGYWLISIDWHRKYLAHRLAWLYQTGCWPKTQIDHIDENKTNNAINNLREANNSQNHQNIDKPQSNNKTGYRGVSMNGTSSYRARLTVNKREVVVGYFKTAEEAYLARLDAREKYHPFAPKRRP